jgi:hypothetical protein
LPPVTVTAAHSVVVPSVKSTLPVGESPLTVAVSVTVWPAVAAAGSAVTTRVVVPAPTEKLTKASAAAPYAESPAWDASSVQVPVPTKLTTPPATVQTSGVVLAIVTVSPEDAVALTDTCPVAKACAPGFANVIVWPILPMATLRVTVAAVP